MRPENLYIESILKMKKRGILSIIIFLLSLNCSFAQFEYYKPEMTLMKHSKGERSISLSPQILVNTPNGLQFAGGLKTRFFISNHISLDADMVFGCNYGHFGPGIVIVPFLLMQPDALSSGTDSYTIGEFFVFMTFYVLSFEHISYHIPLKKYTDLTPYVSLLRFKSAGEEEFPANDETGSGQVTFATGIEFNKYLGRFVLSPFVEYNVAYTGHFQGINMGVYFGICFPSKN
jgi:hypothetical protein